MPDRTPTPSESRLTIDFDPHDSDLVHVSFPYWGVTKTVNIGAHPTWPTIVEVNDLIASTVRSVLDEAYEVASGMPVERPTEPTHPDRLNHDNPDLPVDIRAARAQRRLRALKVDEDRIHRMRMSVRDFVQEGEINIANEILGQMLNLEKEARNA